MSNKKIIILTGSLFVCFAIGLLTGIFLSRSGKNIFSGLSKDKLTIDFNNNGPTGMNNLKARVIEVKDDYLKAELSMPIDIRSCDKKGLSSKIEQKIKLNQGAKIFLRTDKLAGGGLLPSSSGELEKLYQQIRSPKTSDKERAIVNQKITELKKLMIKDHQDKVAELQRQLSEGKLDQATYDQKLEAITSRYDYQTITLADIKETDNILVYLSNEVDLNSVIQTGRIDVIR